MTTTKFQSEPTFKAANSPTDYSASENAIVAKLESAILGICLRRNLSRFDMSVLDSISNEQDQIFIVRENKFIYPEKTQSENYTYGLVFTGHDLNVCDLKNRHQWAAGKIEDAWPSLLTAASRISDIFDNSGAAMAVNRNSGRIIAVTGELTAITGLSEEQFVGVEYSAVSRSILEAFKGKKITIENFGIDEIHISIISFSNVSKYSIEDSPALPGIQKPDFIHHRYIDENQAIGLHFSRFNSILNANLQGEIGQSTLAKIEEIVASFSNSRELIDLQIARTLHQPNFSSVLRLLLQTLVIAHRIASSGSINTSLILKPDNGSFECIVLETKPVFVGKMKVEFRQWLDLAMNLASQIGLVLSPPQIGVDKIVNKISFTKKRIQINVDKK
jgi:hypothetical protein